MPLQPFLWSGSSLLCASYSNGYAGILSGAGSLDRLLFSSTFSAMNPCLGSPFGQGQQGEMMVFFPCVGLDPGGMSNHRESSCFYTEKLQLHVSLKAAELLTLASVVHATACPSEHSLPICLHLSGINRARVLCCVRCLRIGDLVLTWYASDVGKPSVALNFLITTSAPVFAPKFRGRLSTHPLQGGPALLNSWHSE